MFASIISHSPELSTGIVRPTSVAQPVGRATRPFRSIVSVAHRQGRDDRSLRIGIHGANHLFKANTLQRRRLETDWKTAMRSNRRDLIHPAVSAQARTYVASR